MRYVKAWLLGAAAAAILAGTAAAVLSAVAASGAIDGFRLAAWRLVLLDVRTVAGGTETTVGAGLPAVAALGGLLNTAILALLVRRERRSGGIA